MVGLPTTAEEKFRDAVYFFNRMLETRTNVYEFPFNFSAFLSASRSITFYLQEQHTGNSIFATWYKEKQEEMKTHPSMKKLKELRNEALHSRPIELFITQGGKLPPEGLSVFSFGFKTDQKGNMQTFVQLKKDGPEVLIESQGEWNLESKDGPIVLQVCDEALRYLRHLLDEWHEISEASAEAS